MGSCLILLTSVCYASVSILTRKMQKITFSVISFYYSCLAFPIVCIMILGESWVHGHAIRLWSYDGEQYAWMCGLSTINFFGLNAALIAMQNERSGFVTMMGYIGVVYAFLGDILIFNEKLAWLEVVGILIVLTMNISLVCSKFQKEVQVSE